MRLVVWGLLALAEVPAGSTPAGVGPGGVEPEMVLDLGALRESGRLWPLPEVWLFQPRPGSGRAPAKVHQSLSPLPPGWNDEGWFEVRLQVVGPAEGRDVQLWLQHVGDVEVFLDGRRVGGRGAPHTAVDLLSRAPYVLRLGPGEHRLALHLRNPRADELERLISWTGFSAAIGLPEVAYERQLTGHVRHVSFHGWLDGFALALVLLHLALFALRPSRIDSLICGGSVLAFGLFMHLNYQSVTATTAGSLYAMLLWSNAFIPVGAALLPRFFCDVTHLAPPRSLFAFQLVAVPVVVLLPFVGVSVAYLYAGVAVVWAALLLVRAHLVRAPEVWVLSIGGGVFMVAALVELAAWFIDSPIPDRVIMYGFSALLISMSVYLARDFARTERESAQRAVALREAEARAAMAAELERVNRELHETQMLLVQNEKMVALGQLAAGLSHEMNTPLGAIQSGRHTVEAGVRRLDEVLKRDPTAADRVLGVLRDAARVVGEGASRVALIVKKLETFARLDESEQQRFDLCDVVRDTLDILEPLWPSNVELRTALPASAPVFGTPAALNQAFHQVVSNALQAQPKGGFVLVSIERQGPAWRVAFEDGGPGVPEAIRSRVFDPGFTTKGNGVGTGLGLSIAYRIVHQHRGEATVESGSAGGARFVFRLPAEGSSAHSPPEDEKVGRAG